MTPIIHTLADWSFARGYNPGADERRCGLRESGEPPRNRTENPQIKSLLLCQLS